MKSIQSFGFLLLLLFTSFLGCNNNPTTTENERHYTLKIIPSNQVYISWDSTIYQHNTSWSSALDSSSADSVANLLSESEILVEEMWYPNEDTPCLIPMRAGSELIIRVNRPDTTIYKYGFQKTDGSFPINCFASWRYYKFADK